MRFLTLLLALFFAFPAFAVNDWGFAGCESGRNAGNNGLICFDFDSTITPGTVNSFSVNAGSALACFDPNIATAGAATATGKVWYCGSNPGSVTTATCGVEVSAQAGATLTGANGVPAAQLACVVLGPGPYLLEVILAPGGGQTGVFSVHGGR